MKSSRPCPVKTDFPRGPDKVLIEMLGIAPRAITQRIAKGAGGKGPRQKSSKQVSESFSTIFAQGKKRQESPKSVKQFFRHFSTIFERHHFSGAFCGGLKISLEHIRSLGSRVLFVAHPPSPRGTEIPWMSGMRACAMVYEEKRCNI